MASHYVQKLETINNIVRELRRMKIEFWNQKKHRVFLSSLDPESGGGIVSRHPHEGPDQEQLDLSGYIDKGFYPTLLKARARNIR